MVQPQVPTTPQHPIHVKQQELHHHHWDPPVDTMPTPHKIHHPIKHRQPLLQRQVERHHPSQRRRLVVRRPEVHGGGYNRHILQFHLGRKAIERRTVIIPPNNRVFRDGGERVVREGSCGGGGSPGEAAPPRERVAAAEDERLGEGRIRRAESKGSVIHVLMQ
nr:hypothetical protein TorRG33x02_248230 [Ipomoea trifida]